MEKKEELQKLILQFFKAPDWDEKDTLLQELSNFIIRLPYHTQVANSLCLSAVYAVQEKASDYMRAFDDLSNDPTVREEQELHILKYEAFRALQSLKEIIDLSGN